MKAITYQAPGTHLTIDVTPAQEARMQAAGVWPRDHRGNQYCNVSHGLHWVEVPTFTDAEIDRIINGESASDIIASNAY